MNKLNEILTTLNNASVLKREGAIKEAEHNIKNWIDKEIIGEDIPENWLTTGRNKQRKIGANNLKAIQRKKLGR